MTYINVIDLDKTLIPYDSFQRYVLYYAKKSLSDFVHFLLLSLRYKFGVINVHKFCEMTIQRARRSKLYKNEMDDFARTIVANLNNDVIATIRKETQESTINILCTASPVDYVSAVADKLGWECLASSLDKNNIFNHLYGLNKLNEISRRYPKEEYIYNFAISDSEGDLELLKHFNKFILYK